MSRKRGAPGNRTLPPELRELAMKLVRGQYSDFGPTLAHEKLLEVHGVRVSRGTIRAWMISDGAWTTRRERKKRVQQPRRRRASVDCRGRVTACEPRALEDVPADCREAAAAWATRQRP